MVTVAIRQLHRRHDGLDFFGHISTGTAIGISAERHLARQLASVDLIGTHAFAYPRDLVEFDRTGAAVCCRREVEWQALKVLRRCSRFGRQTHQHIVGLVIAGSPHANVLTGDQSAQLVGNAAGVHAKVRSSFMLDGDVNGRFVGFNAGLDIDKAFDLAQFGHDLCGQTLQLGLVRAEQVKIDLLGATHAVELSHMGDGDARQLT